MNVKPKEVKRVRGKNCDHVFLIADGTSIRLARIGFTADKNERGNDITAECPIPRCGQ